MYVKNMFLQGELEEQVYMVQPPRFQSGLKTSAVFRLMKSLYGLKQASCPWNAKITQGLHKMGFSPSKLDSSLFISQGRDGPISILLYVDDLVITSSDLEEIDCVKSQFVPSFEMKDMANLY